MSDSTTIALTPDVLRALGEGVSRLNDGDLDDGAAADKVVETLRAMGYRKAGYDFVKQARFDVIVDEKPFGSCETEHGVRVQLKTCWVGAERKVWDHDQHCWREDLARWQE